MCFHLPWRHIRQSLFGIVHIFQDILNGRFQIESLNQSRFMQRQSVAHTAHFNAFRLHAHTQLGMLADAALDYIRDVFQSWSEIFESAEEMEINVIHGKKH